MEIENRLKDIENRLSSLEAWRQEKGDTGRLVLKLGLSRRALNVLRRAGCDTVDDIIAYGPDNLRRVYNCGEKTYLEILNAVS